jgi:hypothetical protein
MLTRRKLLGMLAAGAIVAPSLLIPKRSIFLPPIGGWPRALATMSIPAEHVSWWAADIAAGRASYDVTTEIMTWLAKAEDHPERWSEPEKVYDYAEKRWTKAPWTPDWKNEPFEVVDPDPAMGGVANFSRTGVQQLAYRGSIQKREMSFFRNRFKEGLAWEDSLRPKMVEVLPVEIAASSESAKRAAVRAAEILARNPQYG